MSTPRGQVRMKQIVVAPFTTERGSSYSTLGLGTDGKVYRYDPKCEGWIAWPMKLAGCRNDHPARR